ncbi:MAG: hypothetical protein F6K42_15320 [Leptolyngbya sp. SIO1D8]|nr:hypothetical protein [Leptolyngbya sp. SIO1D8]
MQLIIHRLCNDDQASQHDKTIRIQWADQAPTLGEAVSMGGAQTFEVAQVYTFSPGDAATVSAVHMVFNRLPGTCLDPEQWDCWQFKDLTPDETFHVKLEDVGLPELSYEINYAGQLPRIGARLQGGVPTGEGTQVRLVLMPWEIDDYSTYTPVEEDCPCSAVYLASCKPVAMEAAIAA